LVPGTVRVPAEPDPGGGGEAILCAGVARFACRDDVFPRVRAAAGTRDDVIDVLSRRSAVLALERVADEHRTPGQAGARAIRDANEVLETDDRRDRERESIGGVRPAVLMDHVSLVLEDAHQRPPP